MVLLESDYFFLNLFISVNAFLESKGSLNRPVNNALLELKGSLSGPFRGFFIFHKDFLHKQKMCN